ncbi:MAG: aminotransferase class I/II-fold pyridoxal phosphate-dependent enzyme, partial [Calditrichaeota bacterium]|nr:aminotransferase class I/II-fold pyridoxal phosphate-dependent enzyme [Calditrichota bacterium]
MISEKFKHAGDSVFYEMTKLANENQAINLAQGFPNFEGPELLKDVFANEIKNGWNQYISSPGLAELREELAKHYSERYQLNYHPETEITITHGATEALFNVLTGLLSPGDEVIIFEPFYDAYIGAIQLAGAKARAVRIDSLTFEIEWQSLEKQLNPAVKMILINTPHNPIGKLFSSDELNRIAVLAKQHDLVIVSDEVYEHITFDGKSHQSIAQIPGMQERTIVISSIAKTYSFTGWKVGWVMSPSKLTRGIRLSHQLSTFCTNQAGQKAA